MEWSVTPKAEGKPKSRSNWHGLSKTVKGWFLSLHRLKEDALRPSCSDFR